ncbi:putative disease resistance RPP13-like protein 1 [Hevea brasiliensis]|uniref:putative disease resistance RPP13-like protein 1 n=1 Tax=Hevea brasiliensis TaxID=3981 RepID=UPI0025FED095|nr:putative disease resistance RPP13-like protein 1 [Hevea brasiliensis]XP_057989311.1 putative disease resistance RPP13-like protein 1 [Hevea brasiliensis]XP_057989312.1 putative disease resistance RPP13-like protein 1 [Hevea brasiliensis]XP_057989313.1 putative disease resistance RPP13-like protein 1 [Hevea brasiliensis]
MQETMSVIGSAALSALFQVLFEKIASSELLKFAREKQVLAQINKWEKMLLQINAVLDDAEDKQTANRSVKIWLTNLKCLAYDVEDVLDEFATQCLGRHLMGLGDPQPTTSKLQKFLPTCCTSFNPKIIMFNSKMMTKIEEITTRLEDIVAQRNDLDLRENVGKMSKKLYQPPPTTCLQNEPQVYGRDEDKRRILDLLLRDGTADPKVSVIPIVGMGGVGKTTLARLVYHDKASQHFDAKAWVCVSDEFDIMRITKAILESITWQPCDLKELNQVQLKLSKELAGKQFLIVLDDVWSESYEDWNTLSSPFMDGAQGSKVIITTRSTVVAQMMGTVDSHALTCISDDDCWLLFSRHAFENRSIIAYPNLETLRERAIYRCGGLPLAAKTLGGLFRGKDASEWDNLLNSKIWNLQGVDGDVLPVLRLSYYHLPSYLKRCFAYCAILPKDYEFEEKELVLLWMAEGLIQQTGNEKHMEDIGLEYFRDLSARSLFQASGNGESQFVMHDLVNDLAQRVAGETCFRLEDELVFGEQFKKERARHSSYIRGYCDGIKRFKPFHKTNCLRTFLPLSLSYEESYIANDIPSNLLSKLGCLRVLSFSHYHITELPDSIGDLKHLRYLNLSYTKIRALPESTTSLWNLQTLILEECSCLKELPSKIGNLINLRHLDITNVNLEKGIPLGVKELKSLLTLSNFPLGKDCGADLAILMNLKFLRGALHISRLENVTDALLVREANLMDKKYLDTLLLEWKYNITRADSLDRAVLAGLQPHRNLKKLSVMGYAGTTFPSWIGDSLLHNLEFLRLENCKKCASLPLLGLLPSLKELVVKGMSSIKRIDHEFCGESYLNTFPTLETLRFMNMPEWEDWNTSGLEFPCLQELAIEDCPKLSGKLPNHLPLLKKLVIRECEQFVVLLPSLPVISVLEIERCKEVDCGCIVEFGSLNSMVLSEISKFSFLSKGFIQGLKKAKDLSVIGDPFPSLPSFVFNVVEEEKEEMLPQEPTGSQLETLKLTNCESLLPYGSLNLMCIRELTIEDCPRLVSFPEAGFPSTLRVLEISNCNSLASFPDAMTYNSVYLEELRIERCNLLMSLGRGQLPPTLKRLMIKFCHNLQSLLYEAEDEDEESFSSCGNTFSLVLLSIEACPSLTLLSSRGGLPSSLKHLWISHCSELTSLSPSAKLPARLEYLQVWNCSGLTSLSSGDNLPASLKHLEIWYCSKLESIAERFDNNASLERISIRNCDNLKSLPSNLHKLINLHYISLSGWPSLVSFPWQVLPATYSEEHQVEREKKFEGLLDGIHELTSLHTLLLNNCPGIVSFPEGGLPTNLTSLYICHLKICKPLFEWGLHRLTSLTELHILECSDVVSFPDDEIGMMLPTSLTHLSLGEFANLGYLSTKGFENLASLEYLCVYDCPKLAFLPKNGLPSSLMKLYINNCPLLKERCQNGNRPEWFKIANIPHIKMDNRS